MRARQPQLAGDPIDVGRLDPPRCRDDAAERFEDVRSGADRSAAPVRSPSAQASLHHLPLVRSQFPPPRRRPPDEGALRLPASRSKTCRPTYRLVTVPVIGSQRRIGLWLAHDESVVTVREDEAREETWPTTISTHSTRPSSSSSSPTERPHAHRRGDAVRAIRRGGAPRLELLHALTSAACQRCRGSASDSPPPGPAGLSWPRWVRDESFDVSRHVRAAGLPRPGGEQELLEWAGEYFSQRLDRSRPLWELVVLELADGRWALATKTHHCMVDGVGSVDIGYTLLDLERNPPEAPAAERPGCAPSRSPADAGDRSAARRVARPDAGGGLAAAVRWARRRDAQKRPAESRSIPSRRRSSARGRWPRCWSATS